MPTAAELFQAGQLNEAIDAQLAAVRSAPLDSGRRTFLFELLAFACRQTTPGPEPASRKKGVGICAPWLLFFPDVKPSIPYSGSRRRWSGTDAATRGRLESHALDCGEPKARMPAWLSSIVWSPRHSLYAGRALICI